MAGVLPYITFNPFTGTQGIDDVWVQISKEKGGNDKGTYDAYSGKVDPGESVETAALREFAEESCGMFGPTEKIAEQMYHMGKSKSTFVLNAERVKSREEIIKGCSSEAFLKRKKLPEYQRGRFQEKTDVKWVKLADLVDACVNKHGVLKQNGENLQIRGYFARNIVKEQKFLNGLIDRQQHRCAKVAAKALPVKVQKVASPAVDPVPTPANTATDANLNILINQLMLNSELLRRLILQLQASQDNGFKASPL
jgi:hypothetical protein